MSPADSNQSWKQPSFDFFKIPRELRNLVYHEILKSLPTERLKVWRNAYGGNWSGRLDLPACFESFKDSNDPQGHQLRQRYSPFGIEILASVSAQFASELTEELDYLELPITLELDLRCKKKAKNPMSCGKFAIDPYMKPFITRIVLRCSPNTDWAPETLHAIGRPFLSILVPELFNSMPRLVEAEVSLWQTWYLFTHDATLDRYPYVRCLDLKSIKDRPRYCHRGSIYDPDERPLRFVFSRKRLAEWLEGSSEDMEDDAWITAVLNFSRRDWVWWLPLGRARS